MSLRAAGYKEAPKVFWCSVPPKIEPEVKSCDPNSAFVSGFGKWNLNPFPISVLFSPRWILQKQRIYFQSLPQPKDAFKVRRASMLQLPSLRFPPHVNLSSVIVRSLVLSKFALVSASFQTPGRGVTAAQMTAIILPTSTHASLLLA